VISFCVLATGCGRSEDAYRGPLFEMRKPSVDWTLVWQAERFTIPPPAAETGAPSLDRAKVLEMLHAGLRASVEVYFIHKGAEQAEPILASLQRRAQRRDFRLGEPKPFAVGGRSGTAVIGSWRQRRDAPVVHCYCVRVPLGSSLWCFVGTVEKDSFDEVRGEFEKALASVKFR
jgi:hypothetical protein